MEKFLLTIALNYMKEKENYEYPNKYTEIVKKFIWDTVSTNNAENFEMMYTDAVMKSVEDAFVDGMKLAIDIMNNKYYPEI